ncbi:MAG: hypothetical protein U1A27_06960 [Phycisphaerae bacterium]
MARTTLRISWLIVAGLVVPAAAQVSGRIARVGLSGGGAQLVRGGAWTVVEVRLGYSGSTPFAGVLEVSQPDRDGDVARYRTTVALAPESTERPFQVYFVPNLRIGGGTISVRLLDERGQLTPVFNERGVEVSELTSDPVQTIDPEAGLILDLSEPRIALLGYEPPRRASAANPGAQGLPRWQVRSLDPRSLPTRWIGLECADVIVWDDPDPAILQPAQVDALVEWVRQGGRLLLSAARNWQAINGSALADLLPASVTGVSQVNEVQEFTEKVLSDPLHELDSYFALNPLTRCQMKALPGAAPVPGNPRTLAGLEPIILRRNAGRGTVTFVGAALRELLAPVKLPRETPSATEEPQNAESAEKAAAAAAIADRARQVRRAFLERVIGIESDEELPGNTFRDISLFDIVRATIGFQAVGAIYLLAAVLFAVAYVLCSTVGVQSYLRRRGQPQHNWSGFALVALAGCLVGGATVGVLRGWRTQLEQTTVVDAAANQSQAVAAVLMGVKTPSHVRLSLRLPNGQAAGEPSDSFGGTLRVLPLDERSNLAAETFVAPEAYECSAGGEELDHLPIRATLKELDGQWEGLLDGRLEAQLRVRRFRLKQGGSVDRFIEGSFIRNRLGVDLTNCFLLDASDEFRAAPGSVRVFDLGSIPATGSGADLTEANLRRFFFDRDPKDASRELELASAPGLTSAMRFWCNALLPFYSADGNSSGRAAVDQRASTGRTALLLLSVMSAYDPAAIHGGGFQGAFLRGPGRRLDCLHQVGRDRAVLLGFSDQPPAATLEVSGRRLRPRQCTTLYRFIIPVERVDGPG